MLRVVFFGTPSAYSRPTLDALTYEHRVIGIVQPRPQFRARGLRRIAQRLARAVGRPRGLEREARALGISCLTAAGRGDPAVPPFTATLRPDVLVVAGYPWILPALVLDSAPRGAFNVHPSLLPRHRGVMPLVWTYLADDREAGVTVHRVTARVDAGAIARQASFPLPRGRACAAIEHQAAAEGARLLAETLRDVAAGGLRLTPQDDARASRAPGIRPGTALVDFAAWDVERVWHVLAGLAAVLREPLTDDTGATVDYRGVGPYRREEHGDAPGSVCVVAGGWQLRCRGGTVPLVRPGSAA